MKKLLMPLILYTLTNNAMAPHVIIHETEEITLTFKTNQASEKTLLDDAWESASFDPSNTFAIGEKVVIKNGLLSALNLNLCKKVTKKIVTISHINGANHTFEIASKHTDEDGKPLVKREITVSAAEMFGKIPQSLAESLQYSLNSH